MNRAQAAQLLSISPQANEDAIKKAFRKKAMLLHPDRNKSVNARSQFIEIHEAYEYLIDIASGKKKEIKTQQTYHTSAQTSGNKFRSKYHRHRNYTDPYANMSREDFEARYEKARKAAAENLDRESNIIYQNALHEYQNSWRKPVAKVMAVIGIILACLFIIDFALGTKEIAISSSKVRHNINYNSQPNTISIQIKNHVFVLPNELNDLFFTGKIDNTITIKGVVYKTPQKIHLSGTQNNSIKYSYFQTHIFKDLTKIKLQGNQFSFELKDFWTVQGSFPFIPILLLLPLLSFWFEKATFNFVFFGVYYNIYAFPILAAFLLLNDNRIFRLLDYF